MKLRREADLKWRRMAPGMTPKLSKMFELRMLRQGKTIKDLTDRNSSSYLVPNSRYKVHCALDPLWARRVAKLNRANISRKRRETNGKRAATKHYCLKGLHRMTGRNIFIDPKDRRRRCRACLYERGAGRPMTAEHVEQVKAAVLNGATFNQMCNGRPAGGGPIDRSLVIVKGQKLQQQRRLDPELDAFLTKHFEGNDHVGQLLRYNKDASEEVKTTLRLIGKIRHRIKSTGAKLPRLHEQRPRRRR